MNNFKQKGDVITYANSSGSAILSGSVVVVGALLGVAVADIADGESGAVRISGVCSLPKSTSTAVSAGDALDYDVSAEQLDAIGTPASGDLVGCCVAVADASESDSEVDVLLNVGGATVTE